MTLIDPEVINAELLPALLTRDVDRVFEFLTTHATDYQSTAQVFETVPRLISTLIENHPQIAKRLPDETWTFEHVSDDPEAGSTMQGRMVVAALNGDDETLTALVKSLLQWPEEQVEKVLAGLMVAFIRVAESFPESQDSGSER